MHWNLIFQVDIEGVQNYTTLTDPGLLPLGKIIRGIAFNKGTSDTRICRL